MKKLKILSIIKDERIDAWNYLIQTSIKDYLNVSKKILDANEYQRRKVQSSKTVYSLLRNDLREGCTIPPIFLAVRIEAITNMLKPKIGRLTEENLINLFVEKKLIILDGLQRTFQMIELENNLKSTGEREALEDFYNRQIRLEVYVGINKIGILYRMLTLNTGQTPMSVRHQVEILYQDYLGKGKIPGVEIIKEVQGAKRVGVGRYKFNEIVDGFQSYLDKDELAIDKTGLLEDIKSIQKISKLGKKKDLFKEFVLCYHHFIEKICQTSKKWKFEEREDGITQPFGKNSEQIFIKSQVLTGFGAAIALLEDSGIITDLKELTKLIKSLHIGKSDALDTLIDILEEIKNSSKKIGNSQRRYFYHLFKSLFNRESESFMNLSDSIKKAYKIYQVEFD
jgi:hypothetical protein